MMTNSQTCMRGTTFNFQQKKLCQFWKIIIKPRNPQTQYPPLSRHVSSPSLTIRKKNSSLSHFDVFFDCLVITCRGFFSLSFRLHRHTLCEKTHIEIQIHDTQKCFHSFYNCRVNTHLTKCVFITLLWIADESLVKRVSLVKRYARNELKFPLIL
jgi:hypothetical protein